MQQHLVQPETTWDEPAHFRTAAALSALPPRLDKVCDRFEAAWKEAQSGGPRPCLEEFLAGVEGTERQALLLELLGLETDYRRKLGESPTATEYRPRFPGLPPAWLAREMPTRAPQPPRLPERIGRFRVSRLLGEGSFGRVYQAHDEQLDRPVAVKVAKVEALSTPARVERFLREARSAARLRHPGIVPLFDAGRDSTSYYIASAFISGHTLEDAMTRPAADRELHFRQSAQTIRDLAEALAYAHEQGIVHRDIKPANVMVDDRGRPMLMDFGLAARLDGAERLTHEGTVLGTPRYMAPEQAAGQLRRVGPASDQYSLGVILYEMLTSKPPFDGPVEAVLNQHIHEDPVSPRRRERRVPRDLETICLKTLAKKPAERYADCRELADDLRRFLDDEPIQARKAGLVERLVRWSRRRPAAAGLAGTTLLALLALLAAVGLYARSQAQELRDLRTLQDGRERINRELGQADQDMAGKCWSNAVAKLERILLGLDTQPDLRAEMHNQVEERRQLAQEQLERQRQAHDRLREFQRHYDDALFHQMGFGGMELADSRTSTQAAARAALAVYGLDTPGKSASLLKGDQAHLTLGEHARLIRSCYELLLIWAQTNADNAEEALVLLKRAQAWGRDHDLKTRACYLAIARALARGRGQPFDPAQLAPEAPSEPTGPLDWFLAGLESYQRGNYKQAAQECETALRQQDDCFWSRYLLGICHLRLGHWVEGKAAFTICIHHPSLRPSFVWPLLLRGFASSELGHKHKEAAEYAAARADFDQVLAGKRDPLVEYVGLVNRGVLLIRQEQWLAAVQELKKAIAVKPEAYQAHLNLGMALQGLGQGDQALAALNQAVRRAPDLAVVYESRARLHLQRNEWPAARADFEQAIARDGAVASPERLANNLVELGRLLHREGKNQEALACYDRAREIRPQLLLAQRFRAEALLALERHDEAGQALDEYLSGASQPAAKVFLARGLIHAQAGKLSAAIAAYHDALRMKPGDTATLCHRGWAHLLADAVPLGLEDFETCLKEDPASSAARVGRASARIRLKQLDGALADAREAEKQERLPARLLYHLACVYAQASLLADAEARPGRPGQSSARGAAHQDRALGCLRRTLEEVPEEKRAAFWRSQVEKDPALAPIRRTAPYWQLARQYGQMGS
jgi:tetratricopeptide (TPR) repeat protein